MTSADSLTVQPHAAHLRPHVAGKFIFAGDEKLYIRGVTYGTFRPGADGREQHDPLQVARDFEQMREAGINTVRTYTVPPRWFLDLAHEQGLYVMVGLPWEQHVTFLDKTETQKNSGPFTRNGFCKQSNVKTARS